MSFTILPFSDESPGGPTVRGAVHRPAAPSGDGLLLTHGANFDIDNPLLVSMAVAFAEGGVTVLRCNLPSRQSRTQQQRRPRPNPVLDRAGLHRAVRCFRQTVSGRMFIGGQSYGGRLATMIAADEPEGIDGLLVLGYPLQTEEKAREARTRHFTRLQIRALFVHGSKDQMAPPQLLREAITAIPVETRLVEIEGAGHSLGSANPKEELKVDVAAVTYGAFREFF